ncbi:MAG: hypothetical protein CEN92_276, partial [Candidatus Berkelbacteria bacterium Licking1014_96]
ANVARLMGGLKAGLVYSDPPYGVQYDGGVGSERGDAYKDTYSDYQDFLYKVYSIAFDFSDDKAALMIWYASKKTMDVLSAIEKCGYLLREILIWGKLTTKLSISNSKSKILNPTSCRALGARQTNPND